MAVVEESHDRISDLQVLSKSEDLSSPEIAIEFEDRDSRKKGGVKECVQHKASESGELSEDVGESPKSLIVKSRMKKIGVLHSQVLKIREEDSHVGEDIVVIVKDNLIDVGFGQIAQIRFVSSTVDVVLSSRLILPSSPLSGKTTVKASS